MIAAKKMGQKATVLLTGRTVQERYLLVSTIIVLLRGQMVKRWDVMVQAMEVGEHTKRAI